MSKLMYYLIMEKENNKQNNKEEIKNWHQKCMDSGCRYCHGGKGLFWGWFFVILGVYFLARELGIFSDAFWPILLIAFGIYLLNKKRKFHKLNRGEVKEN
ncbi:MAG: hypothetical protein COV29_01690 [Candidatus Yanofskybacteria bacterium CG10_big_fil_rev_8_21_14_0_10_36_16]|uniref:LiaF transmembrane domain-containing protein n=1 Tax=Candidatus Yanofskybacteria bacterium CG10_big_fil_rev_8_21_14_0_10_36_16 TaxID=1975096 RepID=A0A2J0Q7C3_9BACT|nr:MAG: hypothetical protein COV29_01690 [Candidatus Yanofskybacteria bacterium CG10_big_fil_rev_8_21_14_0_10_36_16]